MCEKTYIYQVTNKEDYRLKNTTQSQTNTKYCSYSDYIKKPLLTFSKRLWYTLVTNFESLFIETFSITFSNKIESVQYNAALSITGAIRGTSRKKLYQELGLESLRDRRWYRRLVYFFNIVNRNSPAYLNNLLPTRQYSYNIDRSNLFSLYSVNSDYFKNSFFPFCVREWNKLGPEITNLKSVSLFKKSILSFIRANSFSVYNVHDPIGLKYLTRLRLNLSHLREHKFRHNFLDTVNPLCSCSLEMSVSHFLLHRPFFTNLRITLLDNLIDIIGDIYIQSS